MAAKKKVAKKKAAKKKTTKKKTTRKRRAKVVKPVRYEESDDGLLVLSVTDHYGTLPCESKKDPPHLACWDELGKKLVCADCRKPVLEVRPIRVKISPSDYVEVSWPHEMEMPEEFAKAVLDDLEDWKKNIRAGDFIRNATSRPSRAK